MTSTSQHEIVITGMGVVCPTGVGFEAFAESLDQGRSGVRQITSFDSSQLPVQIAGEVVDFEPKAFVRPRKSLKVMSRDMQFAVAAAGMAVERAGWQPDGCDPRRFGVVMGADRIRNKFDDIVPGYLTAIREGRFDYERYVKIGLYEGNPLTMLKNLPNMLACHISISQDAQGPNNTLNHAEVSSLLAIGEAASVIERGMADIMLAGGASSRLHPLDCVRSCLIDELSHGCDAPESACRPFDARRDGTVRGEGAAVIALESRAHAEARGAKILARVLGWSSSCRPMANGRPDAGGLEQAIHAAIEDAGLTPEQIGHVNAHGLGTIGDDQAEAQTLASAVPNVPVTALKSYFGNLLAGTGAVEFVGSLVALETGRIPPTLNYEQPDPACPIDVVRGEPRPADHPTALLVNQTSLGQAAAMVIATES